MQQLLFSSALDDDAQPSTFPTPLTDTPLLKNDAFLTTLTLPALDSRFVTKCYVLRNYASGQGDVPAAARTLCITNETTLATARQENAIPCRRR